MAVHINILSGGNITITTGNSTSATRAATRIWWSSDESNYNDYLIEGALDCPALIEKGLMPEGSGEETPAYWFNPPVKVEIGSDVTSIVDGAFSYCTGLTSVTIPNSVTNIGGFSFDGCSDLTSVTFLGKTLEQVQNIEDGRGNKFYPWGISDTNIISVA